MGLPPDNVAPDDLFKMFCEVPRPSTVVDNVRNYTDPVTGKKLPRFRLLSLSQTEIEQARADGLAAAHRLLKTKEDEGLERKDIGHEVMRQIATDLQAKCVLMAAVCWENPIPGSTQHAYVFTDLQDFQRARMTPEEIGILYTMWEKWQHDSSPMFTAVANDEELNAWIVRLAAGAAAHPLSRISLPALVDLAFLLARRTYSLSAILESHSEKLPKSLAARLETWGIGTLFSGELPATAGELGLMWSATGDENSDHPGERKVITPEQLNEELSKVLDLGTEPITVEHAAALARDHLGRGPASVGEALAVEDLPPDYAE